MIMNTIEIPRTAVDRLSGQWQNDVGKSHPF